MTEFREGRVTYWTWWGRVPQWFIDALGWDDRVLKLHGIYRYDE